MTNQEIKEALLWFLEDGSSQKAPARTASITGAGRIITRAEALSDVDVEIMERQPWTSVGGFSLTQFMRLYPLLRSTKADFAARMNATEEYFKKSNSFESLDDAYALSLWAKTKFPVAGIGRQHAHASLRALQKEIAQKSAADYSEESAMVLYDMFGNELLGAFQDTLIDNDMDEVLLHRDAVLIVSVEKFENSDSRSMVSDLCRAYIKKHDLIAPNHMMIALKTEDIPTSTLYLLEGSCHQVTKEEATTEFLETVSSLMKVHITEHLDEAVSLARASALTEALKSARALT